jgi:hypothetical protein
MRVESSADLLRLSQSSAALMVDVAGAWYQPTASGGFSERLPSSVSLWTASPLAPNLGSHLINSSTDAVLFPIEPSERLELYRSELVPEQPQQPEQLSPPVEVRSAPVNLLLARSESTWTDAPMSSPPQGSPGPTDLPEMPAKVETPSYTPNQNGVLKSNSWLATLKSEPDLLLSAAVGSARHRTVGAVGKHSAVAKVESPLPSSSEHPSSDRVRLQRRLESNRRSAQLSRDRKRLRKQQLQQELDFLREQSLLLDQQLLALQQEIARRAGFARSLPPSVALVY